MLVHKVVARQELIVRRSLHSRPQTRKASDHVRMDECQTPCLSQWVDVSLSLSHGQAMFASQPRGLTPPLLLLQEIAGALESAISGGDSIRVASQPQAELGLTLAPSVALVACLRR